LVVAAVGTDTPAAKAGIQKNDVLTTIGGQEIAGLEGLHKLLEAAGEKAVSIGFIRAGKKQSVEVTPQSSTAEVALKWVTSQVMEPKFWLGVGLAAADDTLRSQLSVPAGEGLVVTNVENDSPAAKAGVMINDVLLKLDGKSLTAIEALSEQLQSIADKSVALELLRRGKPATLTVTPEKHATPFEAEVHFLNEPGRELILLTPQRWEHLTLGGALSSEPLNVTYTELKPDLAKQLNDLEVHVKELEASLAALRGLLETPAQSAPSGEEKK
jgi:serine protease Do